MSGNKDLPFEPILVGGRSLADRLAQRTHPLVIETVDLVHRDVTFYRLLPDEALRNDVTTIVRRNLELFISMLRTGADLAPELLADISESARQRAQELVPLGEVLRAYHLAAGLWWETISEWAVPEDVVALARTGRLLNAYTAASASAVLAGYGSDHVTQTDEDSARRSLFVALSTGVDVDRVSDDVGIRLARLYWVVALHVERNDDESSTEVDTAVAERRKVRHLQRELDQVGRDKALGVLGSSGGAVLIPIVESEPAEGNWASSPQYLSLCRRLGDLEKVIGASTVAAVHVAAPPAIPAAVSQAREVLNVARKYGRTSGVVRLEDLAVEYQLTRPSAALPILADVLSRLESDPAVLETLESFIDSGFDRATTARQLHVHPNTVVYRLRKASSLTGLDLSSPKDLVQVTMALGARRALGMEADSSQT